MSPLVSLVSVSKSFGFKPLFSDISFVVQEGDRTALIGPNGAGKSTLFKVIALQAEPDSGEVSYRKGISVAYISQLDIFSDQATIRSALLDVLSTHLGDGDRAARLSKISGVGELPDLDTPIASLSGGWKKRVSILRGLIQEPNLLLLDEPTNHLDIESIIWLENILERSQCAVVFISHDRYFIERLATRVIELDRIYPKGFLSSEGSYSTFLENRETFLSQQVSYRASLANKVRREVEWLRQGVKARGTKAKGRIQQAEKMIGELKGIKLEKSSASFEFSESEKETKELIVLKGVSGSVAERTLFNDLTITIGPGTRVGISGANGAGKSTLIKVMIAQSKPDSGRVKHARDLRIVYFDQSLKIPDETITLQEALCAGNIGAKSGKTDGVVFNGKELHVATWAKRFLFHTDQLSQKVSSLSGGERARVLLAQLMLQPADILVLDEPSNDLDIPTLDLLEETLCEFSGGVVLVTHDRHMLDAVCNAVIGLDGEQTAIFADYAQFMEQRQTRRAELRKSTKSNLKKEAPETKSEKGTGSKKLTYAERLELEKMEETILEAEKSVAEVMAELESADATKSKEWLTEACETLAKREQQVADLYQRWEWLLEKSQDVVG